MAHAIPQAEAALAESRPLCVDLDGTLVKSDTLTDSLLVLLRKNPASFLLLPWHLLRGRADFKAYVAASTDLDVAHLPYNQELLHFLEQEQTQGRKIYLATGADLSVARRVAEHLGLFAEVMGSDGSTNLTGEKKLAALRSVLHSATFDYIGNDKPDLPLLAQATEPMVANPSLRLRIALRARGIQPVRVFQQRSSVFRSLLRAARIHQWLKNLLIFVPLLLSHMLTREKVVDAMLAFCCFSLTASSAYLVNDLLDMDADRRHPRKRLRPFAAGNLSAPLGFGVAAVLLVVALWNAQSLPNRFYEWLLVYLVSTLAYSISLKRYALVDVLVLSGLYTLRLLAGSAATGTHISHWLAGFAVFLFFSLAIAKRFAELENLRATGSTPKNDRGYQLGDLEQLRSFGTTSAFAAVVIFAIYISSPDVMPLYHKPHLLWLIMPLMILWLCRIWLLASRGGLHEDPLIFAVTDRMSLLIGAATAVVVLLAV